MTTNAKMQFGEMYEDRVSGWKGMFTARYEYMNGCVRVELSGADENGQPKAFAFDEEQIVDIQTQKPPVATSRHGGPQTSVPVARI